MSEPIFSLPPFEVGNFYATAGAVPTSWAMAATFVEQLRAAGGDGDGEVIGIIDTGIDTDHPEFAGKIIAARSFVPGESVEDGNGHGTHVACTAGGNSPTVSFAPKVKGVVAGKGLSNGGSGGITGIQQAFRWMMDVGVNGIGLSIGGGGFLEAMEQLFAEANARGLYVSVAMGNERGQGGVVRNPSSALLVAAVDRSGRFAPFSNPGANPDVVGIAAPGVDIVSAWPGGGYNSISGTSMAQPLNLGVMAAFNSARTKRGLPRWKTSDFRSAYRTSAIDAGSPGADRDYGPGLLDGHFLRNLLVPNPPEVK